MWPVVSVIISLAAIDGAALGFVTDISVPRRGPLDTFASNRGLCKRRHDDTSLFVSSSSRLFSSHDELSSRNKQQQQHRPSQTTSTTTKTKTTNVVLADDDDDNDDPLMREFRRDLARLSALRPNNPFADRSAPLTLISAGSSYTRVWTHDTWRRHGVAPHVKYWRHVWRWPKSTTTRKILPAVLLSTAWAVTLSLSCRVGGGVGRGGAGGGLLSGGSSATTALLTAPLALLLTLRTNSSLGRLLEARSAWGRLVLHARSTAGSLKSHVWYVRPRECLVAARLLAATGWLLKAASRGETRDEQLRLLDAVGVDDPWLRRQPKLTVAALQRVRQIVDAAFADVGSKRATYVAHAAIENRIAELESVVGVCERLLASPIPPTYSRHLSRALFSWLLLLPFGLVGAGLHTAVVAASTAMVSYVLIGIDEIGMEIENPFPLLPLQQLSAAVQNDVASQMTLPPLPPLPRTTTTTTTEQK